MESENWDKPLFDNMLLDIMCNDENKWLEIIDSDVIGKLDIIDTSADIEEVWSVINIELGAKILDESEITSSCVMDIDDVINKLSVVAVVNISSSVDDISKVDNKGVDIKENDMVVDGHWHCSDIDIIWDKSEKSESDIDASGSEAVDETIE